MDDDEAQKQQQRQQQQHWKDKLQGLEQLLEKAKTKKYSSIKAREKELDRIGSGVRRYKALLKDSDRIRTQTRRRQQKVRDNRTAMDKMKNNNVSFANDEELEVDGYNEPPPMETPAGGYPNVAPNSNSESQETVRMRLMLRMESIKSLQANDQATRAGLQSLETNNCVYRQVVVEETAALGGIPPQTPLRLLDNSQSVTAPRTEPIPRQAKTSYKTPLPKKKTGTARTMGKTVKTKEKTTSKTPVKLFKAISKRLSPRSRNLAVLSPKERKEIAVLLAQNVYEVGTIPHEPPHKDSYRSLFEYSNIVESVQTLLDENPTCNVFIYKDTESRSIASYPVQFHIYECLVVPEGEEPPKWLDTAQGEGELISFKELSLEWVNMGRLKNDLLQAWSETLSDRVFLLQTKCRRWRNPTDEKKALFLKRRMLDVRSHTFPPALTTVKFSCSVGGVLVEDIYAPGEGLSQQVEFVVEDLQDKDVEVSKGDYLVIRQAMKDAFAAKEAMLAQTAQSIRDHHDMDKIDQIFTAKIYPVNVDDAVLEGARVEKILYRKRMIPKDGEARESMKKGEQEFEQNLINFVFKATPEAAAYGPARQFFAGANYVHEAESPKKSFAFWGTKPAASDGNGPDETESTAADGNGPDETESTVADGNEPDETESTVADGNGPDETESTAAEA